MKELAQKMQINLYRHISEGYSDQNQDGYTDAVNDMGRLMIPIELNENQQIVLEWLQAYADKDSGDKPMQTIFFMWDCIRNNSIDTEVLSAIRMLSRAEQFQVLAAFAAWGMSEVAE